MSVRNKLLTLVGFLLLGIGAVGVIIPILPTTPFVLIATACFSGNPRVRAWLMKSRFFAEHVANYKQRTGLRKHTAALSLGFLWITMLISMLSAGKLWVTLLLSGIGIAVTIHILWIARPKKEDLLCKIRENITSAQSVEIS